MKNTGRISINLAFKMYHRNNMNACHIEMNQKSNKFFILYRIRLFEQGSAARKMENDPQGFLTGLGSIKQMAVFSFYINT